jgi:hypothetical protein
VPVCVYAAVSTHALSVAVPNTQVHARTLGDIYEQLDLVYGLRKFKDYLLTIGGCVVRKFMPVDSVINQDAKIKICFISAFRGRD